MRNIDCKNIKINDGFWKIKQDMVNNITLKSVYERFKETHRFDALDCTWKEGDPDLPHVFWDSDIAKWIESVGYNAFAYDNDELIKIVDESVEKIIKNRDENGYFNSHFLVTGERFTVRNEHELYCAGHLMEAAVAYYKATGKRALLDVMCKYADYIEKIFIKEQSAEFMTPGHPEIELALVKLYEVTGEKRYLEMSKFFIDNHGANDKDKELYPGCHLLYNQDEKPIRERDTVDGHCVRALYLLAGAADIAYLYNDKELFEATERCFENVVNKRMYITGATGSTCHGESFTIDYDLPNRDAYAETCAAISLAFFANRMIRLNADSKYADAVEKVMYNGALSGISVDGKGFFYENPLEIDVDFNNVHPCTDGGRRYPITQRKEVFDCSCCPPNVTRFIAGIGEYMYLYNVDTLFINQYIASETQTDNLKITQETQYPSRGEVKITLENNIKKYIALRIPGWCNDFSVNKEYTLKKGYAYVEVEKDDEIIINFNMPVRFVSANKKVHTNSGRVAIMRGPVVYCLEGVDNGKDLTALRVDIKGKTQVAEGEFIVPDIIAEGFKETENDNLYFDATDEYIETSLKFIPYYAYANRGETDMLVWVLKK
ncbi:MAG: glycoside hydrolase family 127 protein [Ruminococcaceae bacterium]|nr:glycoside hydrolase family 127 protein [Oscillospiraceae bacterium]